MYNKGYFKEALAEYLRADSLDPDNSEIHFSLGRVFAKLGRFREALASFDFVIRFDPTNVDAYLAKANAYRFLGKDFDPFADFERVVKQRPKYPPVRTVKGYSLEFRGRDVDAPDTFIVQTTPDLADAVAYVNASHILSRYGHYGDALAYLDLALSMAPTDLHLRMERCILLSLLGRPRDALNLFIRLHSTMPTCTNAQESRIDGSCTDGHCVHLDHADVHALLANHHISSETDQKTNLLTPPHSNIVPSKPANTKKGFYARLSVIFPFLFYLLNVYGISPLIDFIQSLLSYFPPT